jgi:hypothetical protein
MTYGLSNPNPKIQNSLVFGYLDLNVQLVKITYANIPKYKTLLIPSIINKGYLICM